jgi:hypothetical protein
MRAFPARGRPANAVVSAEGETTRQAPWPLTWHRPWASGWHWDRARHPSFVSKFPG